MVVVVWRRLGSFHVPSSPWPKATQIATRNPNLGYPLNRVKLIQTHTLHIFGLTLWFIFFPATVAPCSIRFLSDRGKMVVEVRWQSTMTASDGDFGGNCFSDESTTCNVSFSSQRLQLAAMFTFSPAQAKWWQECGGNQRWLQAVEVSIAAVSPVNQRLDTPLLLLWSDLTENLCLSILRQLRSFFEICPPFFVPHYSGRR